MTLKLTQQQALDLANQSQLYATLEKHLPLDKKRPQKRGQFKFHLFGMISPYLSQGITPLSIHLIFHVGSLNAFYESHDSAIRSKLNKLTQYLRKNHGFEIGFVEGLYKVKTLEEIKTTSTRNIFNNENANLLQNQIRVGNGISPIQLPIHNQPDLPTLPEGE